MPLLFAISLAAALMQAPAAPAGPVVSGRVLEAGTQVPIAGAQVTLMPVLQGPPAGPFSFRPKTATTDENGRFTFIELESGRYRVTAQKSGFANTIETVPPVVELKGGDRIEDLRLMLQRGGVISGRVVDQAGVPVADARLMVLRKAPTPPPSSRPGAAAAAVQLANRLLPAGSGGQTNDLGEFRVHSLAPGDYFVQAAPRGDFGGPFMAGGAATAGTTMVPTYFPSTTDSSAAQPIHVTAGQTASDVVVRMVIASAFRVSGAVVDEAGQAVTNAMVRLMPQDGGPPQPMMGPFNQGRTDAKGGFTFGAVTNGAYTLIAVPPVVTASAPQGIGGATGGFSSFSFGGTTSGVIGSGVTTESSNGTTVQYRDDAGTQIPVTVYEGSVTGLQVVVRRPSAR